MSGCLGPGDRTMLKRLIQFSLIILPGLLIMAMPAYAAIISGATFMADVVTINSGTTTTNVATVVPINTQALIDGKYATSDLKNTALQTLEETDAPYMPGVGANPWVFFIPTISASEQRCYSFYTGGPAMQSELVYFPDTGGMTVADDDSIELGNNFEVKLQGFVDTSVGDNKNLVFKDLAFKIWVSNEKEISTSIYKSGGWTACKVTATNINSATHFIEVTGDASYLRLYIDGVPKGTPVLLNGGVPPSENGWSFATNGSMLYLEWLKIWVD